MELLQLLPLVGGGALEEEDLLLLLLLLLGEGLLQQLLVVGALDWVVLKLHGDLLLLSTGALIPVRMMLCLSLSFSGMGLSWLFCSVCPLSSWCLLCHAALITILTSSLAGILLYIP